MPPPSPDLHLHFHGDLGNQRDALRAWIQHLLYVTPAPLTRGDLQDLLRSGSRLPYPIDVEPAELESVLHAGFQSNVFTTSGGNAYSLTAVRRELLDQVRSESVALEGAVRANWLAEIHAEYPELPSVVDEELWDALIRFICDTVRHFRDRVSRTSDSFNGLDNTVLPTESPLRALAETAFPAFLLSTDPQRRALFRRFLSHALFAFTTSVSKEAATALRGSLAGRALWLDTNVLLPALGLTGDPEFEAAIRRVLAIARKLKLKLLVTTRTVDEFSATFNLFIRRAVSDSAPEYVQRRMSHSIDRAYFLARSADFLTPEEFVHRFQDVVRQITVDKHSIGIGVDDLTATQADEVRGHHTYAAALNALRSVERRTYQELALDHDAFHLAYADSLRRRDTWGEARGWFLTLDRSIRRAEGHLPGSTPLSMTVDEWVITFRQFVPRVDDFEDFVSAILTRTMFPSFYLNHESVVLFAKLAESDVSRDAHEVLSRLLRTSSSTAISQSFGNAEELEDLVAGIEDLAQRDAAQRQALADYGKAQLEARISEERTMRDSAAEEATKAWVSVGALQEALATILEMEDAERAASKEEARVREQIDYLDGRRAQIEATALRWTVGSTLVISASAILAAANSPWIQQLFRDLAPVLGVLGLVVGGGGLMAGVRWMVRLAHMKELTRIQLQLATAYGALASLESGRVDRETARRQVRRSLAK